MSNLSLDCTPTKPSAGLSPSIQLHDVLMATAGDCASMILDACPAGIT